MSAMTVLPTAVQPQRGFHPVYKISPRRQSRNDLSHCSQNRHAVNRIEGVLEIEFDEYPVRVFCVAFGPLPGGVHCSLCASWGADADLKGFEAGPHVFFHAGQQTLPNHSTQSFPDRDRSQSSAGFGQGHQWSSTQQVSHCWRGVPARENVHDLGQMTMHLVRVRRYVCIA